MHTRENRLEDKRLYYLRNQQREQAKARERAQRKRLTETLEEATLRKEKHRAAQARYRAQNRQQLSIKSWEYRKRFNLKKSVDRDEEEFQRLMALEDSD